MGNSVDPKNVLVGTESLIVLNAEKGRTLKITNLSRFPHGYDGLRVWQAGIILARYAILHRQQFQKKYVLELGCGTGIAGLSVLKFTSCSNCLLSDYIEQVVENARRNCQKNGMKKAIVTKMSWKDYDKFNNHYDIIIGSQIIGPGAPMQQLLLCIKKFLTTGGMAIFVSTMKKGYIQHFLQYVLKEEFDFERKELSEQVYLQSPLANKLQGYSAFPGFKNEKYQLYIFRKKEEIKPEVKEAERRHTVIQKMPQAMSKPALVVHGEVVMKETIVQKEVVREETRKEEVAVNAGKTAEVQKQVQVEVPKQQPVEVQKHEIVEAPRQEVIEAAKQAQAQETIEAPKPEPVEPRVEEPKYELVQAPKQQIVQAPVEAPANTLVEAPKQQPIQSPVEEPKQALPIETPKQESIDVPKQETVQVSQQKPTQQVAEATKQDSISPPKQQPIEQSKQEPVQESIEIKHEPIETQQQRANTAAQQHLNTELLQSQTNEATTTQPQAKDPEVKPDTQNTQSQAIVQQAIQKSEDTAVNTQLPIAQVQSIKQNQQQDVSQPQPSISSAEQPESKQPQQQNNVEQIEQQKQLVEQIAPSEERKQQQLPAQITEPQAPTQAQKPAEEAIQQTKEPLQVQPTTEQIQPTHNKHQQELNQQSNIQKEHQQPTMSQIEKNEEQNKEQPTQPAEPTQATNLENTPPTTDTPPSS